MIEHYEPGNLFQQDNARIHVSGDTQNWFEKHGIHVIEWPAHSPDLNPIEPVWSLLKKELFNRYPRLAGQGRSSQNWEEFRNGLVDSWDHIPQGAIDSLIRSIPRRIAAVRAAKGYYTR